MGSRETAVYADAESMASDKKLFLLDGMALAYRSHFALINNPRTTSTGMNTSMVFVFTNSLIEILNKEQPTHLAVVFDTDKPTYRHEMYSEYKAQRESMPEDIRAGFPYLDRVLAGFRVPVKTNFRTFSFDMLNVWVVKMSVICEVPMPKASAPNAP